MISVNLKSVTRAADGAKFRRVIRVTNSSATARPWSMVCAEGFGRGRDFQRTYLCLGLSVATWEGAMSRARAHALDVHGVRL